MLAPHQHSDLRSYAALFEVRSWHCRVIDLAKLLLTLYP